MKIFISLLILISSFLYCDQEIPEKLILSSKAFVENKQLYPIYRIDLIIFSHKQRNEIDKQEQFPELGKFNYSTDLLRLYKTPSLLVKKEAIEEGLVPSTQVIKLIDVNKNKKEADVLEEQEIKENEINSNTQLLPYEFFELIKDSDGSNEKFVKRLNRRDEYDVLFYGSWYQPLFSQDISSPVYIQSEVGINRVYGELLLYKERFLHSTLRIRLSEKTIQEQILSSVNLYNFNNLLKISKADNRFVSFFKSLGEDVVSFSNWILRTIEFSPISTIKEKSLIINTNSKDLFEINQQIKMKEDSFHYIDHPYFGAVIRVSSWKTE